MLKKFEGIGWKVTDEERLMLIMKDLNFFSYPSKFPKIWGKFPRNGCISAVLNTHTYCTYRYLYNFILNRLYHKKIELSISRDSNLNQLKVFSEISQPLLLTSSFCQVFLCGYPNFFDFFYFAKKNEWILWKKSVSCLMVSYRSVKFYTIILLSRLSLISFSVHSFVFFINKFVRK